MRSSKGDTTMVHGVAKRLCFFHAETPSSGGADVTEDRPECRRQGVSCEIRAPTCELVHHLLRRPLKVRRVGARTGVNQVDPMVIISSRWRCSRPSSTSTGTFFAVALQQVVIDIDRDLPTPSPTSPPLRRRCRPVWRRTASARQHRQVQRHHQRSYGHGPLPQQVQAS